MRPCRPAGLLLAALLPAASSCAEEPCRELDPAFELTLRLPAAVSGNQVASLEVEVQAGAGFKRDKRFPVSDQLDDGETSIVVELGQAGAEGFTATVSARAKDTAGTILARGSQSFPSAGEATGDGCNFFTMTLEAAAPPPPCTEGETRPCYGGPAGTAGKGPCKEGTQTCASASWGACQGEVLPATETCDGEDNDCDGQTDEAAELKAPACALTAGVCQGATQRCGGASGWLPCAAADYQAHDAAYEADETLCDGKDNDCDGQIDENHALDVQAGCWDIRARVTQAEKPIDPGELKVLGQTAGVGSWVYALLGPSDPQVSMTSVFCAGIAKIVAKAWVIRRTLVSATEHRIRVEGQSDADCMPAFTPAFAGEVEVNPALGWTLGATKCPASLMGNGFCALDPSGAKAVWLSGPLCTQCCACPEAAAVDLEFTASRK